MAVSNTDSSGSELPAPLGRGGPRLVLGLGVAVLHLGLLAGLLTSGPVRAPTTSEQHLVMLSLISPAAPQPKAAPSPLLRHRAGPGGAEAPAAEARARSQPAETAPALASATGAAPAPPALSSDGGTASPATPAPAMAEAVALRDAPPRPWPGNPLPVYPAAAREDGIEGRVSLRLEVDDSGHVLSLAWVARSGSALLDRAAREALRAWRFEPARRDGQAVAGSLVVRLQFRLQDGLSWLALAQNEDRP